MAGADKPLLVVEGTRMVDAVVEGARPWCDQGVVVVGAAGDAPDVVVVREEPAGGGPAAALAWGVQHLADADWVVALAADAPWSGQAVGALLAAATADGAIAVDAAGRVQPLLAVYRRKAIVARGTVAPGTSMRSLIADLDLALVPVGEAATRDIDTWDDYRRWGLPEGLAEGSAAGEGAGSSA